MREQRIERTFGGIMDPPRWIGFVVLELTDDGYQTVAAKRLLDLSEALAIHRTLPFGAIIAAVPSVIGE